MNKESTGRASGRTHDGLAHPVLRLEAFVVDFLINALIYLSLANYIVRQGSVPMLLDSFLSVIIWFMAIALISLPIYGLMISKLGGGFGKILTGTAIVDLEEKNVSFWRGIFRNTIGYAVSGSLLWLGFIWILKDEKRQGWHDLVSETLVVKRNEIGKVLGIMAIAALLFVNYLTIKNISNSISENTPFYESLFEDINYEVQNLLTR